MLRWAIPALILLTAGLAGAAPPKASKTRFVDVTPKTGIEFRHTFGDDDFNRILKATGSGVGLLDYDGDGDLDIYFVNGSFVEGICRPEAKERTAAATNHLYRNDGPGEDGVPRFTDVTEEAGVGDRGYGMGCLTGDYDNDGDADLYVTNYGPNVLYANNGDGTFTDVTAKAGVTGEPKLNGWVKWSTNAVFLDYDRDGRLDLWVCNYLAFDPQFDQYYGPEGFPGPLNYLGQPSTLYRNRGDGTFEDVTKKAGVLRTDGRGMGASVADFNGDGWPDVFEANDAMSNYLFVNRGDGTFVEVAEDAGCAMGGRGETTGSMHGMIGDYDGNGLLDILVPDMNFFSLYQNVASNPAGKESRLLVPFFEESVNRSGIAAVVGQYIGWGGFFFDYDHDGRLDVFVATGKAHQPENQQNVILRNVGGGRFVSAAADVGRRLFMRKRLSRGTIAGDLDGDGDLDIVVVNIDTKITDRAIRGREGLPTILLNDGGNRTSWLTVKLEGTKSNRDGIGAKVRVKLPGRTLFAEAQTSPSYLSTSPPWLHFGLGGETRATVSVEWPSGATQEVQADANQVITIREKGGE